MAVSIKRKNDALGPDMLTTEGPAKRPRTHESEKAESIASSTIASPSSDANGQSPLLSDKQVEQVSGAELDAARDLQARGNEFLEQGRFFDAITSYREAYKLFPHLPLLRAQLCFNLSVALRERGDEGDVEEEIRTLLIGLHPCVTNIIPHGDGILKAELLERLGNAFLDIKDYPRAIEAFGEGKKLLKGREDGDLEARMCNGLGLAFEGMRKWDEAAKNYSAGLDVEHDNLLMKLALAYNLSSNLPLSEGIEVAYDALCMSAEKDTPQNEYNSLKAHLFWRLGDMLIERNGDGDRQIAIKCCVQALELEHENSEKLLEQILKLAARAAGVNPEEAVAGHRKFDAGIDIRAAICDTLGQACLELNDFSFAILQFEAVLKFLQNAPDCIRKARTLAGLGFALECRGESEKALDAYRRGVAVKHDNPKLAAELLYNQGQLETPLEAIKCFEKAFTLPYDGEAFRAKICAELGNLYASHVRTEEGLDKALQWYEKAANLGANHLQIRLRIYKKLGDALVDSNPHKAAACYKKLLEMGPSPLMDGQICLNLGLLYKQSKELQDLEKAIEFLVRGINGQHGSSHLEADMRYLLGMIFAEQNKFLQAVEHFEAAKKITESSHPRNKRAHEDYDLRVRILMSLGVAYSRSEESLESALSCFEACLAIKVPAGSSGALTEQQRGGMTNLMLQLQTRLQNRQAQETDLANLSNQNRVAMPFEFIEGIDADATRQGSPNTT